MRRLIPVGFVLLAASATSCITAEAECHQQAISMLGCCPFCDDSCVVSDDQLHELGCGGDVIQKNASDKQADPAASSEPEGSKEPDSSEPASTQGIRPD
jgi:hypothetical protein